MIPGGSMEGGSIRGLPYIDVATARSCGGRGEGLLVLPVLRGGRCVGWGHYPMVVAAHAGW